MSQISFVFTQAKISIENTGKKQMIKLNKLSTLIIVFLSFQAVYAQFPYDSGAFFTPE